MIRTPERDVGALMLDHALLEEAVAAAQADAVRRHRLLGQPVATWRDGRVVVESSETQRREREEPSR